MKKTISALIFLAILVLPGCDEECSIPDDLTNDKYYENEIFNESFLDIYGNWELYEISGGIHGYGDGLQFDLLQIRMFGIYSFIKGGVVLEYGKIVIDEQTDESLRISFSPDEDSDVFMFDSEKNVILQSSDSLFLQSPCCDRYNYHLVRKD
jgi:hypothetical protein